MPHDVEELHRQATAFCIKADFETALELWRQMLQLEPGDKRAIEGVRQCERLVAGESLAPSPQPAAVQEATVAPAPSPEPIDDLDIAIDDALFEAGVATPPATAEAPEPTGEATEDGFAGGPFPETVDLEATKELERRVEALLQQARDHVEQGDGDEAEQVLVRVLILDEENQDARRLQQEIQESRPQAAPVAAPGAPLTDVEFDASVEKEEQEEQEEEVEPQAIPLETLSPIAWAPPAGDAPAKPAPGDDAGPDSPEAAEAGAVATARKSKTALKTALPGWFADRRVQLGAGGVLVLAAVVYGLGSFGGEDAPVAGPVETTRAEKPVEADAGGKQEPEATEEPAVPVVQKDPALLLQEAQAAIEAKDWAAAVVAYNTLLEQVPDHPVALENLPVAMEHYRKQRDQQKTWNEAVSAFESGHFHDALRHFYRMEGGMDVVRLNRYKANGWYNLGVADLQSNRCLPALDHFDEALVIRPGDEVVVAGMRLADACLDTGSPGAGARTLELRALEH
jgi:tetratricopeptide (TPR) repeat protein